MLFLAAHRRQLHLFRRIGGDNPAHGATQDLPDCRAVQAHGALGKPLIRQSEQHPLNIVRPDLTDFVTLELLLPELHGPPVVVHLPAGDVFPLLQPQPVVRPGGEAVPLGKNVQPPAKLEADGGFLFLQLRRGLGVDAFVLPLPVLVPAQVYLSAITPVRSFLGLCHALSPN